MQKTIINHLGHKVGIYYPITSILEHINGKKDKLGKKAFAEYCDDMCWSIL